MYKGFNKIFWGFVFLSIAIISIGSVRIPPFFISWIIILSGVNEVLAIENEEKFKTLKKLLITMILITFLQEILKFVNLPILNNRSFAILLFFVQLVDLVIYYYIMEGSKEIIEKDNMYLVQSMDVTLRNIIVSYTIFMLLIIVALLVESVELFMFSVFGFLIIRVVFVYWVRKIRNLFKTVTVEYE